MCQKSLWGIIREVIYRHGWSEPGKRESKLIETIHPDSFKELEIIPGPSHEEEAKYIRDKIGFKYREIRGKIIFLYVFRITDILYMVAELYKLSDNKE